MNQLASPAVQLLFFLRGPRSTPICDNFTANEFHLAELHPVRDAIEVRNSRKAMRLVLGSWLVGRYAPTWTYNRQTVASVCGADYR